MREAHLVKLVNVVNLNRLLGQGNKLIYFSCPGAELGSPASLDQFWGFFSPRASLLLLFFASFFFFSRKKGEPVNIGERTIAKVCPKFTWGVGIGEASEAEKKHWFTYVHCRFFERHPPQVVVLKSSFLADCKNSVKLNVKRVSRKPRFLPPQKVDSHN